MNKVLSLVAMSLLLCPAAWADTENPYTEKGRFEVGGSVAGTWNPDLFKLVLTPSVGYFILDRVELSVLTSVDYDNTRNTTTLTRTDSLALSVLAEPSYHLPMSDSLFVFAGVGVGVAYQTNQASFALAPRIGLNIEVGASAILTPEMRIPILFGSGVTANWTFGAGFTAVF